MNDERLSVKFNKYIELFYGILTLGKELEIISSKDILNTVIPCF